MEFRIPAKQELCAMDAPTDPPVRALASVVPMPLAPSGQLTGPR
jgi:hypothetical protein